MRTVSSKVQYYLVRAVQSRDSSQLSSLLFSLWVNFQQRDGKNGIFFLKEFPQFTQENTFALMFLMVLYVDSKKERPW